MLNQTSQPLEFHCHYLDKIPMLWLLTSLVLTSAATSPVQPGDPCAASARQLVKEWKPAGPWEKQNIGPNQTEFQSSPTSEVGVWILVRAIPQGTVVAKVSQSGRTEAEFKQPTCKATTKLYPQAPPQNDLFDDQALAAFVKKNKTGVIYLWSPRMGLSQSGIKEILAAAEKRKLPVLTLLDKDVKPNEKAQLDKTVGAQHTRQFDSLELKLRKTGLHYPAMLVFKNGKLLPGVKYGYEKAAGFSTDLSSMLR